ncbi:uncharacterized protein LOC141632768 [Silene latifolia]|uniref:uncharacterized protein LOC141632768 n=1 Tax=Silene latifolia TaxID=37657 RepID=UPI003D770C9E
MIRVLTLSVTHDRADNKQNFKNLENRVSQLANAINQLEARDSNALPSQTVVNPKNVSAVSLRNGRQLVEAEKEKKKIPSPIPVVEPEVPFPDALKRTHHFEHDKDIYEVFQKCEVNIPLLNLLKIFPKYAKFLKEFCTIKRNNKLKGVKKVKVSEHVSAMFQRKLPTKCSNPGMFTIPCTIGNTKIQKAMLDLGASINVMPYSLYQSMKLVPLHATSVVIQLADRSNVYPKGIVEDVLVLVDNIFFPADFYVLDMEHDKHAAPILLGRPFLKTASTKIDVSTRSMTMESNGHIVQFNVYDSMKYPTDYHSVNSFDAAPVVELKALPEHLKYIFLGEGETLPVIISSKLTEEQEARLKNVLVGNKLAIGWTIADIKGISPSTCMHRILLEDEAKPRCMVSIFFDYVECFIEVFMDDFTVHGDSFDTCLHHLSLVLKLCIDTNLVLNSEKCHFMVEQGTVLGHVVSLRCIEVDKAKINTISSLPYPTNVREVQCFLGHAGFYRRVIKDFSKIASPLCKLLQKETDFIFDKACKEAFYELKGRLTSAPIIQAPDWSLPFEIMCDASDYTLGAVLGQKNERASHVIHYASMTLNEAQWNYTTTEKELLAIVFALEKFRSYLLGTKVVVFSDHAALRHLMAKKESKPRLIRWILLLSEFDLEVKDKKGAENVVVDHLSRLVDVDVNPHEKNLVKGLFPDESLFAIRSVEQWYANLVNFLCSSKFPQGFFKSKKDKLRSDAKYYMWEEPYLWKHFSDQIIRRCIPENEMTSILTFCHSNACGGHFGARRIARKVLDCGFYWTSLFKDAHGFCQTCDNCQRVGNISRKNEMSQSYMLNCEIFDVWGIDFMGPFPSSYELEHKAYWAIKSFNMSLDDAGLHRKLQLQDLEELQLESYENATTYKERTKAWHDKMILRRDFKVGQKVLLFQSRFRLFPVEVRDPTMDKVLKVNGQRLKPYHDGVAIKVVESLDLYDPIYED